MTSIYAQTTKMPVKVSITSNVGGKWRVKLVVPLTDINNKKSQGKKRKKVSWPEEPIQKVGNAIETERIKISSNGYGHWTMFVKDEEFHKDTEQNTRDNEAKSREKSAMFEKQKSFTMCGGKKTTDQRKSIQLQNYEKFNDPIGFLSAHFIQTAPPSRNLQNYTLETIKKCVDFLEFKKGIIKEKGSAMICWATGAAAYTLHIAALDRTIKHLNGEFTLRTELTAVVIQRFVRGYLSRSASKQ